MSALHSQQTSVHVIYNWTYANAAARVAATGFVAGDVGKLCLQADTLALYMLTATTPAWAVAILPGAIDADTLQTHAAAFFAEAGHGHAPGPATDADTVDSMHAADFATDDHNHSGVYSDSAHTHAAGDAATLQSHAASYFAVDGHGHTAPALDDLTDVTLGTPATGNALVYDTDHWEAATLAGGDADTLQSHAAAYFAVDGHSHAAPALDDLTDVTLGTPATGNVLTYDTDHWESAVPPAGGASALDDLTDVTLGTPATGNVLTYDTDHWEAAAPTGGSGAATSKVGCSVSRGATQSISTGTPTAISWDTEVRDDDGCWSVGTPTRLIAPVAGWYAISAFVWWAGATAYGRRFYILKDGTTTIGRQSTEASGTHNDPANQVSALYYFTANQYVEFMVDQNSGNPVNIQAGATAGMVLVAPLSPAITKTLTLGFSGALTVAAGTTRLYVPWACTIINISAAVGVAPTGASVIVDVLKSGVTLFTTTGNRPTITATNFADLTSVPDIVAIAAGDYLTLDVISIGSTVAGSNLVVQVEATVP